MKKCFSYITDDGIEFRMLPKKSSVYLHDDIWKSWDNLYKMYAHYQIFVTQKSYLNSIHEKPYKIKDTYDENNGLGIILAIINEALENKQYNTEYLAYIHFGDGNPYYYYKILPELIVLSFVKGYKNNEKPLTITMSIKDFSGLRKVHLEYCEYMLERGIKNE